MEILSEKEPTLTSSYCRLGSLVFVMSTVASVSELGDLLDLFPFYEVSRKGERDLLVLIPNGPGCGLVAHAL